jgi:putative transposase
VLGSAIEDHLHTDLVESAMSMAVAILERLADRVNLHADRGCPYTSKQLARFARKHNLAGRVGASGSSGITLRLNHSGRH